MDFQRWMDEMRTRTALVWFLASILVGGMLVFALGSVAAEGGSAVTPAIAGSEAGTAAVYASAGKEIPWKDFGAALGEAKKNKKRILVDVYTDWCGWCKRMDRDTYSDAEVRKYLSSAFVPVRLNAESNQRVTYKGNEYSYRQLASGFRVNGYPTTLFLESDGTHIVTAPGYMKAPDFLTVLRYIGDGHYKNKDFQEYQAGLKKASAPEPGAKK